MISSKCWAFVEDNVSHYLIQCFNNDRKKKTLNEQRTVYMCCVHWMLFENWMFPLLDMVYVCVWSSDECEWDKKPFLIVCTVFQVSHFVYYTMKWYNHKVARFSQPQYACAWTKMQRWCQFHICIQNYHRSYKCTREF